MKRKRYVRKKTFVEKLKQIRLEYYIIGCALIAIVLMFVLIPSGQTEPEQVAQPTATPQPIIPVTLPVSEDIEVFNVAKGETQIMPLEEYIVHVTAAEMPASYDIEALKAGAVAARTFTVRRVMGDGCSEYGGDICTSSAHCQAYKEEEALREQWGDDYDLYINKIREAVAETAGIVITYEGEPIDALYHAVSGGMTENSENVYPNAIPYLQSVTSPGEEEASRFTGEVEVSKVQAALTLNEFVGEEVLSAENIEEEFSVINRYTSGRVGEVAVGEHIIRGTDVRSLFELDSTNFIHEFTDDSVVFATIGFGHGVGMSQAGANAMAELGSTYDEILTHYYTDVELTEIEGQ